MSAVGFWGGGKSIVRRLIPDIEGAATQQLLVNSNISSWYYRPKAARYESGRSTFEVECHAGKSLRGTIRAYALSDTGGCAATESKR